MSKLKILIVDDEDKFREMLVESFTDFGFDVQGAANGQLGFEALEAMKPQILITDVRMPVMDGIALLKKVREQRPEWPKIFIITGFSDFPLEDIYHYGADGVFPKPFQVEDLKNTIKKSLLSLKDQWKKPLSVDCKPIRKSYQSLAQAIAADELRFGKGGFFFRGKVDLPDTKDPVQFELTFTDSTEIPRLKGQGVVAWSRPDSPTAAGGIGIEIRHLDPSCVDPYLGYVGKLKPVEFIPNDI